MIEVIFPANFSVVIGGRLGTGRISGTRITNSLIAIDGKIYDYILIKWIISFIHLELS